MKTINLFDCEIAALNMSETVDEITDLIIKKEYTQHVVLNAGKVVLMQQDNQLKEIIKKCGLINADGQSIVWASKLLGRDLPERVAGIDLMEKLIEVAANKGFRLYFFGAKEEVVQNVVIHYKEKYKNLQLAGYRNGYFELNEEKDIVEGIKKAKADIVFVAFSSPQKEYWLHKYGEQLGVPFVMGVGGSFDVVAGITQRAPLWMQNVGLEWFYRFLQEPKRMWKRYLIGNSKFIYEVLKEKKRINKNLK